jgi:tetrahydromethanopterin S-methyltransferase subunit G
MKKVLVATSCLMSLLYSENINYARSNLQTLTLQKNKIDIYGSILKMNNTLDVLKIKESEFGGTANYNSIGDLSGHDIGIRYGLLENLSIFYSNSKQDIQYSSNTLSNTRNELFVRYNLFNNPYVTLNSGISIDFGIIQNKLKDFYYEDLANINTLIKKFVPNENISLKYLDGIQKEEYERRPKPEGYYIFLDDGSYVNLSQEPYSLSRSPYISLEDTYDSSKYIRVLTGYYTKHSTVNFFAGIKQTKISSLITTNDEILEISDKFNKRLDRNENMLFAGFSFTKEYNTKILEFSYEYDKFDRDDNLDYINSNHIINIGLSKIVNENLLMFINGKLMYRQFNGQIPYLYNEYTQTSYDHKYGYAQAGLIISF